MLSFYKKNNNKMVLYDIYLLNIHKICSKLNFKIIKRGAFNGN